MALFEIEGRVECRERMFYDDVDFTCVLKGKR